MLYPSQDSEIIISEIGILVTVPIDAGSKRLNYKRLLWTVAQYRPGNGQKKDRILFCLRGGDNPVLFVSYLLIPPGRTIKGDAGSNSFLLSKISKFKACINIKLDVSKLHSSTNRTYSYNVNKHNIISISYTNLHNVQF